jgi:glycosyltransferase involved in cell wall biosynthesis
MVYWRRLGSRPATVWLKYLGQAFSTWKILLRDRPDAVFVMSPPVVAGLVVWPYCALRQIPFVVDAHTGAFVDRRWRHFQGLQHWLCRRAATTIITNTHLQELLASHGADSTILPDVPVRYPEDQRPFEKTGFTVAVICSFDYDEPVEIIWQAAAAMPEVRFLVTGDPGRVEVRGLTAPDNLVLTGFLDNAAYGSLIRNADLVMALTTGQHKMLRAAYEAIYQGTPIIISDSPMLRAEFGQGATLIQNTVESVMDAVRKMREDLPRYRTEAAALRERKEQRWEGNRRQLIEKISAGRRGVKPRAAV